MGLTRFITALPRTRRAAPPVPSHAKIRAQGSDIEGLRALEGVTYIPAHDAKGRMDDDLFDMLCEEIAPAR